MIRDEMGALDDPLKMEGDHKGSGREGAQAQAWSRQERREVLVIERDLQNRDVEGAIATLLDYYDANPSRDGIQETPRRVRQMYEELTRGYSQDPRHVMTTFPNEGTDQMILVEEIPIVSLCEHHLLPFVGKAHIGYIPEEKLAGLSKFKRIADIYARRFQVQERLTQQIANCLQDLLSPKGLIVMIEAEHMCMTIRGAQSPGTRTKTSALKGVLLDDPGARAEAFAMMGMNGSGG